MMNLRTQQPLTEDHLRQFVPSIFATERHARTSEKYSYIPTIRVVQAMQSAGFEPMAARQSRTRDESRRGFTKHMIRFRHPDYSAKAVGDVVPEAVLINSHDGSSSYQISLGLFRLLCLNGLMVADAMLVSVRVPHKGDVIRDVIEGSFRVIEEAPKVLDKPVQWGKIVLNDAERMAFAQAAHVARFADDEGKVETPITPGQLLIPRRSADQPKDLWTTYNVVQENVIRGGLSAFAQNRDGQMRRRTTRAVKGIDQDVKLNRALWTLTAKMAELKTAH